MDQFLQTLLADLAILFMMHTVINTIIIDGTWSKKIKKGIILIIVAFSSIALLALPITLNGNIYYDLAMIPLIMLGFRHGLKPIIPAIIVIGLARFFMIDEPIFQTIIQTFLPGLISVLFHRQTLLFLYNYYVANVSIIFVITIVPFATLDALLGIRFLLFLIINLVLASIINDSVKKQMMQQELQFYAGHDPLTGLYNTRKFFQKIKYYENRSDKTYLAVMDIDHFKKINDIFGHLSGDEVLKDLSLILRTICDDRMLFSRYGGEEFILFLYDLNPEDVHSKLHFIRRTIEDNAFHSATGAPISITVSIGWTNMIEKESIRQALDRSDQALYVAKRYGRNRVEMSDYSER